MENTIATPKAKITRLEKCLVGDCIRPARPGRAMCRAHEKRKERHGEKADMSAPVKDRDEEPLHRLQQAAHTFSNADTADDVAYRRALDLLKVAAKRWMKNLDRKASQKQSDKISTLPVDATQAYGRCVTCGHDPREE